MRTPHRGNLHSACTRISRPIRRLRTRLASCRLQSAGLLTPLLLLLLAAGSWGSWGSDCTSWVGSVQQHVVANLEVRSVEVSQEHGVANAVATPNQPAVV